VTTFVVLLSYVFASLIVGVGQTLDHALIDLSYGPPMTLDTILSFAGAYFQHLLLGTFSLLILTGFAAVASILTRSILGGLLAGFGMAVLEPMSSLILVIVGGVVNRIEITNLYQFAATYHLDNARSWFVSGQPLPPPLPGFTAEPALAVSLIALVLWVVGLLGLAIVLLGLAIVLFNRQDVTA
jgi:ABC-type transport system involved in multi-copper enzyme maturation permease subunit